MPIKVELFDPETPNAEVAESVTFVVNEPLSEVIEIHSGVVGPKGDKGNKGDPGGWVVTPLTLPVDLNSIVVPGLYSHGYHSSNEGGPVADGGTLEVFSVQSGGTNVTQVWYQNGFSGGDYTRKRKPDGTWTDWVLVGNKVSTTQVAAHEAKTNPHPEYVSKKSATLGNTANLNNIIESGNYYAQGGSSDLQRNLPVASSGHLNVINSLNATGGEIIQTFIKNGTSETWRRSKPGTVDWQPWVRIDAPGHVIEADPHSQYTTRMASTLQATANLNSVVIGGQYLAPFSSDAISRNYPISGAGLVTVSIAGSVNGVVEQKFIHLGSPFQTYRRFRTNPTTGTWTDWTREDMSGHESKADPHPQYKAKEVTLVSLASTPSPDSLTTSGTYLLSSSSGVLASNDWPADSWAGWIRVENNEALKNTIQIANSIYSAAGATPTYRGEWIRVRSNNVWQPWVRQEQRLVGAGTPNGNISAGLGDSYVDTEQTNGALRWVKTTTGGTSGWKVEIGDTGWRALVRWDSNKNITVGSLGEGWEPSAGNGGVWIRRVGSQVELQVHKLGTTTPSPSANIVSIPSGFQSSHAFSFGFTGHAANMVHKSTGLNVTSQAIRRADNVGTLVGDNWNDVSVTYLTSANWPETLPAAL